MHVLPMTIDEHICSGGIAVVPDLRGDGECYSDDYESLVITQTPAPGQFVSAGQTVINVVTEDKSGNATICTHYLNVTADNPAPTLECPDPIVTWLLPGGYEVPDLTKEVEIIGGCTVYDDLVITQSPAAGTRITTAGVHTITITVTDEYGHTVVCGTTTITLKTPNPITVVTPPAPPVTVPNYVYPVNLLAYWPIDDTGRLLDVSTLINGTSGRDLTASANADFDSGQSMLETSCRTPGPGPFFGRGSLYSNGIQSFLYRADDAGLRLLNTSFTIRIGLRITFTGFTISWDALLKGLPGGYRFVVEQSAGPTYTIYPILTAGDGGTLQTSPVNIPLNTWVYLAMTFDKTLGQLKLYVEGVLAQTSTSAGFTVGDSTGTDLRIGDPSNNQSYIDEVGIWTEAWNAARVLQDYQLIKCLI